MQDVSSNQHQHNTQTPYNLTDLLADNPYPGRGIVVGNNCVFYWIMGRSANSQNRIFTRTSDGIQTEAFKPELVEDPSLIIYHPVRTMGEDLVVTNGDQTDTILEKGSFFEGCLARSFEPDDPNFTPRISACIHPNNSFELSILKRDATGSCLREFFCYETAPAGCGYFLSTYESDGNPLPTFVGEPKLVKLASPQEIWAALNTQNKISLYANVEGKVTLFNKHLGD